MILLFLKNRMPLLKNRAVVNFGKIMKIITQSALLLILPTVNMAANADDALYQHSLGVNWGYGTSILDTKHVKDEEGDMFVGGYYYRYMLQKNFGVEAGYKDAVDGIGSLLSSPLASVEDVTFSGPRLSGYAAYPFDSGFNIYGKAGLTYYTLDYTYKTDQQTEDYEKSSMGGEVAAGISWDYKHIGLSTEYNYAKNDSLELGTAMFGVKVRF